MSTSLASVGSVHYWLKLKNREFSRYKKLRSLSAKSYSLHASFLSHNKWVASPIGASNKGHKEASKYQEIDLESFRPSKS